MSFGDLIRRLSGLDRVRATLASSGGERTLPAYQRDRQGKAIAASLIAVSIVYACVSGYFIGAFQQFILQQFLVPCLVLAAIALWAMPDRLGVSHRFFERSFFLLMIVNAIWPIYLAIALPGLPWININRIALFAALLSFAIVLATDTDARSLVNNIFSKGKAIKYALITFIGCQFFSVFFANDIGGTLGKTINYQILWSSMLVMGAFIAVKPGRVDIFAKALLFSATVLCVIAVMEFRLQRPPWAGHIPSFLQISDPLVQMILTGAKRASDGIYRVQTTFTTSLSCAEFMVLAMPFLMHYFLVSKKIRIKLLLACLYVAIIFTIYVTRSRLGMIGLGIAHLAYPLLIGIRRWSTVKNDLIGPSLIALYPALLVAFIGALLASHRLYVLFLGGAQHQSSNDARESMYRDGVPLILKNPWGFGADNGAGALNYRLPSGQLTIDSYYLSIGLDYGVIGFLSFYGMLLGAMYLMVRVYLTSRNDEAQLAAPVAIALGAFFVIKSVLSQSQNNYLVYALVGVALALNYKFCNSPQKRGGGQT